MGALLTIIVSPANCPDFIDIRFMETDLAHPHQPDAPSSARARFLFSVTRRILAILHAEFSRRRFSMPFSPMIDYFRDDERRQGTSIGEAILDFLFG